MEPRTERRRVGFAIFRRLGTPCALSQCVIPTIDRSILSRKNWRVQVDYQGRDFRFILTGEQFGNESLSGDLPSRGGVGAIDFVRHIKGLNLVQAVKVCADAMTAEAVVKQMG